jgi:7-keto-8-aminopelargonate synthetase-like enzyme
MGTFSKSFASLGGLLQGTKMFINYIKHTARSFMFSASLPAPNAMAALAALDIMEHEPEHVERLWGQRAFYDEGLRANWLQYRQDADADNPRHHR